MPIWISSGLMCSAWPPSWYIPTSNETRVLLDGFWKTIASVLPKRALKGIRLLRKDLSLTA